MAPVRTVTVGFVCALVALLAGLWAGGHPKSLPEPVRDAFVEDDRALRAEVIDTIEDNFYKKVDEEKLRDASLKGMVRSLGDPFSHYLTPKEARRFEESVEGRFDGVGMTVDEDRRGLRVLNVFPGTPARRAGIRKDDLITKVNGKSIAGLSSEVATSRIKGPAGTRVRLEVVRPRTDRVRRLGVTRERIKVPVARGRIVERDRRRIGVVQLFTFSSGAHGVLRQEMEELLDRDVQGLVLDLRGNGGGLLREAVLVASTFIESGTIVSVEGRTRGRRTENAEGEAINQAIPVVVLVDRGSASASEIVAGAIRDRRRGKLVGTRTFGKGLVQEVEPLSNGGVLDLTVAVYELPSGERIGRRGLKPQIEARDRERTRADEALEEALGVLTRR
jgi:carboxyl-terminal processing protease